MPIVLVALQHRHDAVMFNKVFPKVILGQTFRDRLSLAEITSAIGCLGADIEARRALRLSWSSTSLNIKIAVAVENWLKIVQMSFEKEDSVERDCCLMAAVKAAQHYEAIARTLLLELNRQGGEDWGVDDGLGQDSLVVVNQPLPKREEEPAPEEDEDDQEDEDYAEKSEDDDKEKPKARTTIKVPKSAEIVEDQDDEEETALTSYHPESQICSDPNGARKKRNAMSLEKSTLFRKRLY